MTHMVKSASLTSGGSGLAALLGAAHANDNLSEREVAFVQKINATAYISRINRDGLPRLAHAFSQAHWPQHTPPDPYYFSPTYLSLTARRGGLFQFNKTFSNGGKDGHVHFFLCLHPNKPDTLLVFPPMGDLTKQNLANFIHQFKDTGLDIKIARVSDAHNELKKLRYPPHGNRPITMKVEEVEEDSLDWKYPVHTFSTHDIAAAEGPEYRKVRRYMKQFNDHIANGIAKVEDLNFSNTADIARLSALAGAWTSSVEERYGENNTGMPDDYFTRLVDLGQSYNGGKQGLKLRSSVLSWKNKDMAFVVWEPPMFPEHKSACLFASQSLDQFKPMKFIDPISSEERVAHNPLMYLITRAAQQAANDPENPADFMCLGGSETAEMDKYKSQFRDHEPLSPQLSTLAIRYENDEPIGPA